MTRRQFLSIAPFAGVGSGRSGAVPIVPVRQILDDQVKWTPAQLRRFQLLWAEAVRELMRCGIQLQTTVAEGGVWRPAYREPVITGLARGVLNLVVTNDVPVKWDGGRGWCGVTTRYRGHHLCMVALNHAHGNQVPFFAVNTFVHELLHALLHDIYDRPGTFAESRELRVDFHATSLWLFHYGGAVRHAAERYVARLRSEVA